MARKKHPTPEEKKKLDNKKIPNVTMRKAEEAWDAGDEKEADRLWNLLKKKK